MIKVKVFESGWYWIDVNHSTQQSRCDFNYCIYVFGILVYSKLYKVISFQQSRVMFKGCEVINADGETKKY